MEQDERVLLAKNLYTVCLQNNDPLVLIENPDLDLRNPRGREGRMCGLKYSGIF